MAQNEQGEVVVLEQTPTDAIEAKPARDVVVRNALDIAPSQFSKGLERQGQNREFLLKWLKGNLTEGVDYGKIHIVPRDKCSAGRNCSNPYHFSKDSLFKPGAEKIAGMMGFRAVWPSLVEYERLMIGGQLPKAIGLRCELIDRNGHVIAEGFGARLLEKDYGDINKAVKMAKKSALIDAVLNAGGLSEVFTQDVEDMGDDDFRGEQGFDPYNTHQDRSPGFDTDFAGNDLFPFGKHKGQPWSEVPIDYLEWAIGNMNNLRPEWAKRIEREIADRFVAPDSTGSKLDDKIEQALTGETDAARVARVNDRPLKYYADLIAVAPGLVELQDYRRELVDTIHERPLKAFLEDRIKQFTNPES